MLITIFTLGSRGDIQPFIPLGLGLKQSGFKVRFASFESFRDQVVSHGLDFFRISGDPREVMNSQAGQAWLSSGRNVFRMTGRMRTAIVGEDLKAQFEDAERACRDTDALVYSFMGAAAYHAAEKYGIPSIFTLLQPFSRSRILPSMAFPELPLGGSYNRLTHWISEQLIWQIVRQPVDQWRVKSLGLPPLSWRGPFDKIYENEMPFLYGFSPSVVPHPADWPENHHISGYWFLDRSPDWSPPKALVRFLESGPKPISIGFGSMSGPGTGKLLKIAIEAVQQTGQRAILLGGWAELDEARLPATIFKIDAVPHDWLFPRVAAVVHHGGAGTTASGLRAGIPSILVPFFADQPFWGRRVHALGVGPAPIQRNSLSASELAERITIAVEDSGMRRKATLLSERIRAEDGVRDAVAFIRNHLGA